MRKIILDTNAYTKLLLKDRHVLEELTKADKIYLSSIVLGELFAGFKGGSKEIDNKNLLEEFLSKPGVEILLIGKETAEFFGDIKYYLEKNGNPIPANDIWIAACAQETGAIVITYDSHFSKIPGIRVWDINY